MKELEVTVRLRNNRLKERRLALGLSQRELARAAGVTLEWYGPLELMQRSPRYKDGTWSAAAGKLASFHCVEPEELFPAVVEAVRSPVAVRLADGAELGRLLTGGHSVAMLEAPDVLAMRREQAQWVEDAMGQLKPREQVALQMYIAHEGAGETSGDIGRALGVTRSRGYQVLQTALRKVRHQARREGLTDALGHLR